jgi:hypothetical protein
MALMPKKLNELELAELRKEGLRKKRTEAQRKKKFIAKWVSTTPQGQAEVIWLILDRLQKVEGALDRQVTHYMQF